MSTAGQLAALDLTHVLYDDSSWLSLFLALITLSPIFLMASYAALALFTREYLVIVMWAGQWAGEGFNWLLKHAVKQDRPNEHFGNGYGFPSSHSQYMGYFASFLICHLYFRHRFSSTGYLFLDRIWRTIVYTALLMWSSAVAYSRFHLGYHTVDQIAWGVAIGIALGTLHYTIVELIPHRYPTSVFGRIKYALLANRISTWLQIRDGWAVWADAGRETDWLRWRKEWEKQRTVLDVNVKRSQ